MQINHRDERFRCSCDLPLSIPLLSLVRGWRIRASPFKGDRKSKMDATRCLPQLKFKWGIGGGANCLAQPAKVERNNVPDSSGYTAKREGSTLPIFPRWQR